MKYNELDLSRHKNPIRVGRGIAGGRGKTAGRGTKGQGARKSGGVRPGFEGGQMPLYMRLPKLRGFKSHRPPTQTVHTGALESIKDSVITNQALFRSGLVPSPYDKVKLIAKGELSSKKTVKLQTASQSAKKAVEKAGGTLDLVPQVGRAKAKKEDN